MKYKNPLQIVLIQNLFFLKLNFVKDRSQITFPSEGSWDKKRNKKMQWKEDGI